MISAFENTNGVAAAFAAAFPEAGMAGGAELIAGFARAASGVYVGVAIALVGLAVLARIAERMGAFAPRARPLAA